MFGDDCENFECRKGVRTPLLVSLPPAPLLEGNERTPAGNNMPQVPGFPILIADARFSQQTNRPNGPTLTLLLDG
jgi:hypothetical protein